MTDEQSEHWYLAQLKPGGLARARLNLARQEHPTFMPMREVTERRREGLRRAARPLFPGYLFVRITPDRPRWRAINSTYGVSRLVALQGNCPSQVPAPLMAALFGRCDGETWSPDAETFAPGTKVRLVAGPFARSLATIAAVPEAERVYVLMEMMGQQVRTAVPLRDLERV